MRNYDEISWHSEERKAYYQKVNNSTQKKVGDAGEQIAIDWFKAHGYSVRLTTAEEDACLHADFMVLINDQWMSVDVKTKTNFIIELQNCWGNPGWIYTGADIIFQILHNSDYWGDSIYLYRRSAFVDYIEKNRHIFADKYCKTGEGKSILWYLGKKRLQTMEFIKKIA